MKVILYIIVIFSTANQLTYADSTLKDIYEQETKKCSTISCIRQKIDQINDQIIQLLVKRTAYVQRAGDLKLHTKLANDQKRVDDQIEVIGKKSDKLGLPRGISIEVFKSIIKNSIDFEQQYIDRLTQ